MQKPSFLNLERKDWQITITLLIAMLLVIMAHYFAGNVLDEHQNSSAVVTASFEGNNLLNNLDHHLIALESEVRNFVILADEKYAVSTEEIIKKTRADIVAVRNHFANTVKTIQLERLEELVSEKIRFSKNVMDNFRTDGPIAAAKMFGSQDDFMLRENIIAIINDILDFSKIEAGVIRMERIPFSLSSLLHSVENMFRYRADEKQLQFEMEVDEKLPEAVQGDPTRLTQILVNLLSNALKFTNSGSVNLLASQVKQENGHSTVRFTVSDTGIGIPLDKQAFIFERFGQASTDTTRRFGGAGLGLTISKQLVELQGGQIWVESQEGNGAAFMVEIPYDIAETVIGNGNSKSRSGSFKNQQGSILIVEDNMMNSRIVGLLLDDWGFRYDHAENGKIALDKLSHHVYDLILMDIQMPVMDGYTTSQYIRQQLHLKVPIIATTAHAFAGEREKCISYGMNDYISKPIKEDELMALISRYVRRKKQNKSMHMGSQASEKAAAAFDRQYIFDISKGKPEVLREMVGLFISQSTKELEQMEKALQSNNFGKAAAAAHSMKSTTAYMGFAETFDELLSTFEQQAKGQAPNATLLQSLFAKIKTSRGTVKHFLETGFLEQWASKA